jgi:hypothetical protein
VEFQLIRAWRHVPTATSIPIDKSSGDSRRGGDRADSAAAFDLPMSGGRRRRLLLHESPEAVLFEYELQSRRCWLLLQR